VAIKEETMADGSETRGTTGADPASELNAVTGAGLAPAVGSEPAPKQLDALHTARGDTTIAEMVVAKLAGIATREVPGVHAMGGGMRRAFSNITERIPGSQVNVTGGVAVEKGERQTAIEISIIIEYGAAAVEVSEAIRKNVIRAVERATGLEVIEVNINVTDVHLPNEPDEPEPAAETSRLA
jgi:uncharacterized alkaline shock family protein YloU